MSYIASGFWINSSIIEIEGITINHFSDCNFT